MESTHFFKSNFLIVSLKVNEFKTLKDLHEDEKEANMKQRTKQHQNKKWKETSNLNSPFCKRYICVLYHQSYHNIL